MKTTAMHGNEVFSTGSLLTKKPDGEVTVPLRSLKGLETIACGFRQNMLEMGDFGGVDVGAGLGTDFILLRWKKRTVLIRGSELLKAWVKTFAPKDAERFPV